MCVSCIYPRSSPAPETGASRLSGRLCVAAGERHHLVIGVPVVVNRDDLHPERRCKAVHVRADIPSLLDQSGELLAGVRLVGVVLDVVQHPQERAFVGVVFLVSQRDDVEVRTHVFELCLDDLERVCKVSHVSLQTQLLGACGCPLVPCECGPEWWTANLLSCDPAAVTGPLPDVSGHGARSCSALSAPWGCPRQQGLV